MATDKLKSLTQVGTHAVGTINSWKVRTIANGAIVTNADVDNYTIVELGFNADGERTCKQLSNKANKSYLIAAPERRYLGEGLSDFYNAVGDRARIVILDEGVRFETSAFSLNAGVTELANGQVAHFDVTTKKFIVSAAGAAHADYAGSKAKFVVVGGESDEEYNLGADTVRLEVVEA